MAYPDQLLEDHPVFPVFDLSGGVCDGMRGACVMFDACAFVFAPRLALALATVGPVQRMANIEIADNAAVEATIRFITAHSPIRIFLLHSFNSLVGGRFLRLKI